MTDAKQYARKLLVVSLSDKGGEEKKKEDETVKIDLVGWPAGFIFIHRLERNTDKSIDHLETLN